MSPAHLSAVLELAAELELGWSSKLAELERAGVPLNAKHPLLATVEKIDADLTGVRQDAATSHSAMQEAERAVAAATAAGETVDTDHAAFKAMEAAGKDYGDKADTITRLETTKAGLIAQMAQAGITPSTAADGGAERDRYVEELRELANAGGMIRNPKSVGERLVEGDLYKQAQSDGSLTRRKIGDVALGEGMNREELKAALLTGGDPGSAGAFVTPDRQGYYPLPLRPLTVLDLITIGQTNSDLVEFVRMLSLTNAAAETAEAITAAPIDGTTVSAVQGGRKPESGMAFEVVQEGVSTIAHWVPATKRALSDAGQLRTIIDGALRWGLGDRLERQVVNGNGVGENLLGLLQQPGTNAVAPADTPGYSAADRVLRAKTLIRLDGYMATGVILNPLDAEAIWLSRDESGGPGTGGYLFGAPNNPGPRTLWGLPVAESPAAPEGTALVGALQAAVLWLREGTQVLASDSHEDFFTRNLVAVLAEMRAGFGVPTPAAFAEVDLT
jgi:HK97 family phage major capsid protein